MKMRYLIPLIALLASCAKISSRVTTPALQDENAALARVQTARARMLEGMQALAAGQGTQNLCSLEYCGDGPFACAKLLQVNSNAADKTALLADLTPAKIAQLYQTLLHADFAVTTDENEVRFEGVVQDAFTSGGRSTWLVSRLDGRADDDVAVQTTHEIRHDLGLLDSGTVTAGGKTFGSRDLIDKESACLLAAVNGHNGKHRSVLDPQTGRAELFHLDFSDPTAAIAAAQGLHAADGLGVSDSGYFATVLPGLSEKNVLVKATIVFSPQIPVMETADPFFALAVRGIQASWNGANSGYSLTIHHSPTSPPASAFSFVLYNLVGWQNAAFPAPSGDGSIDVSLEIDGTALSSMVAGVPASLNSTQINNAGFIGLYGNGVGVKTIDVYGPVAH